MKTFFFRFSLPLCTLLVTMVPVMADVGGGSGLPVTPYSSDENISVEQVSRWKRLSRTLRIPVDRTVIPVYGNGMGLFYKRAGKNITANIEENVSDLPADIKIPDSFKDLVSIDEATKRIMLKRPMTLLQRNEIINEIWLEYNPARHHRQAFEQMEKAVRRLFLRSRFRKGIFFQFRGVNESGREVSVDFSVVKEFKIVRKENERALFEIVVFPDITPEKLVELKPSYSELRSRYTRVVRVWIALQEQDKGSLYIAGVVGGESKALLPGGGYREMCDSWFEDGAYFIESEERVGHIEANRNVVLEYNGNSVWWAIPSVIQDRDYPFRQYFLIRGFLHHDQYQPISTRCPVLQRWGEDHGAKAG